MNNTGSLNIIGNLVTTIDGNKIEDLYNVYDININTKIMSFIYKDL